MKFIIKRWNKYKSTKRWWSIVLDFLFLTLVVAMIFPVSRKEVSSFIVRQTLISPRKSSNIQYLTEKDWQVRFVEDGRKVLELEEYRGKPIFINYWATWCPPCIAEMPSIQNLYDNYSDKINFIFINNEDSSVVDAFMKKHNYNLPINNFIGGITNLFETSTLPTTIIISPKGRVVLQKTGAAKWDSNKMFAMFDEMIEQN